ncbi:hypothetical protein [Mycobacterium sp. URHB0021]
MPTDPEPAESHQSYCPAAWSDRVKRLLDEAPPLTREDLQEIATLLKMRVV